MMQYVSMCDNDSGAFLGAFIINRETSDEAQAAAVTALYSTTGFYGGVDCISAPVPVGEVVPAGCYGRLLTLADLQEHPGFGGAVDLAGDPA
jgi:hypothetical protein